MANETLPFESYRGPEDYVFVSYAHADANDAYNELRRLNEAGLHIWYDEGITPSARWTEELAKAIENSAVFLAFITPDFVRSENCINELEFALSRQLPVAAVHLQPTELPPGLELSLGNKQAIIRARYEPEAYQSKLQSTLEGLISGTLETQPYVERKPRTRWRQKLLWGTSVVVVASLLVWQFSMQDSQLDSSVNAAIAVLPFEVDGAEAENTRYLGEGIAEDLSMRLGSWRSFPVIASASITSGEVFLTWSRPSTRRGGRS